MNDQSMIKSKIEMLIHQQKHPSYNNRRVVDSKLLTLKMKHKKIYNQILKENETN